MIKFLFLIILFFVTGIKANADKIPIAIFDIENKGIADNDASIISDKICNAFVETSEYIVLERNKINEILKEQGFQQSGCVDNKCIVEMGQLLGVKKAIASSIGKIGKEYFISIRLIDIVTGQIEKTADQTIAGDINKVLNLSIPILAMKFTAKKNCYRVLADYVRFADSSIVFRNDYEAALFAICNYSKDFKIIDFNWDTTCTP
jgi:uncharacterized protein YjhX (UPF0386 family)